MNTWTQLLGTLALVFGCACATTSTPKPVLRGWDEPEGELILEDGQQIAGRLVARDIVIPSGTLVIAVEDVQLLAVRSIRINGALRATSRSAGDPDPNAPLLELEAGEILTLTGSVEGGDGWLPNGKGSSLRLSAPDLLVAGDLIGGQGRLGGSVRIFGEPLSEHDLDPAELEDLMSASRVVAGEGGKVLFGLPPSSSPLRPIHPPLRAEQ